MPTDLAPQTNVAGVRLLLTIREAAAALAISERTLWTLTDTGAVPCVRVGRSVRYAPADLENYIARLRDLQAAQRNDRPTDG
jgi:excisionase family DNA binding protein